MSKGKLIFNGVNITEDERHTIQILLEEDCTIRLVPKSNIKGYHLPDVVIDGTAWEIKATQGKGKNTVKHNLQRAEKQSANVIIDLYRCGLSDEQAIKKIKYEFSQSTTLKRVKIITKQKEIVEISKKQQYYKGVKCCPVWLHRVAL